MTDTIPNVPRELLEVIEQTWRIHYKGGPVTTDIAADAIEKGLGQLRALLSATPPAGVDGLEVVAWVTTGFSGKSRTRRAFTVNADDAARQHTNWTPHYRQVTTDQLCRLSAAQAIIDVLRGEVGAQRVKTCAALKARNDAHEERDAAATECERLRMQLAACGVVALANTVESAGEARQMHPDYMSASCSDVADAVDREIALRIECETMRQQLAVRDEEIERIRVQLMTIASAEPARHSIEWAKAMASTGNNEVYAKWREAFDERDQQAQRIGELEGLLRETLEDMTNELWQRIDAAISAGKDSVS